MDIAKQALKRVGLDGAPVIDGAGRFMGTAARATLADKPDKGQTVSDFLDPGAPTVSESSRLDVALDSLTEAPWSWVPVLDDDRRIVGILSVSDVAHAYHQELIARAERASEVDDIDRGSQVVITADSPLAGLTLRSARLPKGLLITSVSRADKVLVPNGDTVLVVGDRLSILGDGRGVRALAQRVPSGIRSSWSTKH